MIIDLFNDILYVNPIYKNDKSENQLIDDFQNSKKEYFNATPIFEIDFIKPLKPIRKYFCKMLLNETITQFNRLTNDFDRNLVPEEEHFLYQKYFTQFSYYLKNIASYINERELSENLFMKPNNNLKADEAYIIYYFKANAILLLMELQERYHNSTDPEIYSQEEIHEVYFNEEPPSNLYVLNYNGEPVQIKTIPSIETKNFIAIKGDLESRTENKKIISYKNLIAKPDNFARAEEKLFNELIIDKHYNFIPTKGNKLKLAAFIHQLIIKEILNTRIYPGGKPIKERDITKFFAHRYSNDSDADKEFRNFKGANKHKLKSMIYNLSWLDNIS
jgi:hypothetical protein